MVLLGFREGETPTAYRSRVFDVGYDGCKLTDTRSQHCLKNTIGNSILEPLQSGRVPMQSLRRLKREKRKRRKKTANRRLQPRSHRKGRLHRPTHLPMHPHPPRSHIGVLCLYHRLAATKLVLLPSNSTEHWPYYQIFHLRLVTSMDSMHFLLGQITTFKTLGLRLIGTRILSSLPQFRLTIRAFRRQSSIHPLPNIPTLPTHTTHQRTRNSTGHPRSLAIPQQLGNDPGAHTSECQPGPTLNIHTVHHTTAQILVRHSTRTIR